MRVLILGGTLEATALAEALAGNPQIEAIVSLAGRTQRPTLPAVETRIGGFGGPAGLAAFLGDTGIDAVVDATHPFAARMCWNAAQACDVAAVPLVRFGRAAWEPMPGDDWIPVPEMPSAVAALGTTPQRVFLTVGRLSIPDFAAAPHHTYLVRSIDAPADLSFLPRHRLILARGPFDADAEERLMRSEGVQVLVTKNSGGSATVGKVEAARRLGLRVVMVARPPRPIVEEVDSVAQVLAWIEAHRPPP